MAEKEQTYRHTHQDSVLAWNGTIAIIGQVMAFLLGLSGTEGGIFLLYSGKSLGGFGTLIGTLVSLLLATRLGLGSKNKPGKQQAPP